MSVMSIDLLIILSLFIQTAGGIVAGIVIYRAICTERAKRKKARDYQKGSAFTAVIGAVGLVGVLAFSVQGLLSGPLRSVVVVTAKNKAINDMLLASKVVMNSTVNKNILSANGACDAGEYGDCDDDGVLEPPAFTDPGMGSAPTGGGYVPSALGAPIQDSWNQPFGYCVWDHGTGNSSTGRITGVAAPTGNEVVIALVSAGDNRTFDTSCADISGGSDGEGDDLVESFTVNSAAAQSGSLWVYDPSTDEISYTDDVKVEGTLKGADGGNLEVGSNINVTGQVFTNAVNTQDLIADNTMGVNTVTIRDRDGNGTLDGVIIGATAAAAGTFSTMTTADAQITGGAINNAVIGASTPAAGTFTTLSADSLTAGTADIDGGTIDGATIGGTTPAAGTFTTMNTADAQITGGAINNAIIGALTPVAGNFTALAASSLFVPDNAAITVNAATGTVTNLNADLLDGVHAAAFQEDLTTNDCGAGNFIRAVADDGTVTCAADVISGGDASTFGGQLPSYYQRRVDGTCAAGSSIRVVNEDGSVECEEDTGFTLGTGDARYVNLSGDTMTGALELPADPTTDLQAATKQYVDAQITGGSVANADKLDNLDSLDFVRSTGSVAQTITGNKTFSGTLTLAGDPGGVLQAATKQYVDAQIAGGSVENANTLDTLDSTAFLKVANNLSDLTNAGTARTNLGLGTAATLNASVAASNNTVVQRHSDGYVYANYFNTTPNDVSSGVTKVLVETGNDGFMRHGDAVAIREFVKTADGAGSGLDADLLDGQSSAYYQRRVSGTCPAGSSIRVIAENGTVTCETDDFGSGGMDQGTADARYLNEDSNLSDLTNAGTARNNLGLGNAATHNEGSNNGLDADTVDGQHAAAFATAAHNHDASYINVSGDTMTGALTLAGAPTNANHATTKDYVDTAVASAGGGGGFDVDTSTCFNDLESMSFYYDQSSDKAFLTCNPCILSGIGTLCADGSYYAGLSPDGNRPMYATSVASQGSFQWMTYNTTTGFTNQTTGESNTNGLVAAYGTNAPAAKHCYDLNTHGHTDWYLPSKNELNVLYQNKAAIGGFTMGNYWSSTEYNTNGAWYQSFNNGYQNFTSKNNVGDVRCVRRD